MEHDWDWNNLYSLFFSENYSKLPEEYKLAAETDKGVFLFSLAIDGDCFYWKQKPPEEGFKVFSFTPRITINKKRYCVQKISYMWHTGFVITKHMHFKKGCNNADCINPLHTRTWANEDKATRKRKLTIDELEKINNFMEQKVSVNPVPIKRSTFNRLKKKKYYQEFVKNKHGIE